MNKEATNISLLFFVMITYSASLAESKSILHTDVSNAIRQYFKSDCVFLVSVGLQDGAMILSIAKKFGLIGIATGIIEIEEVFANNEIIHDKCHRPLYSVFSINQRFIQSIKSLATTRQYGATWLLLLNDLKINEVLGNTTIPLECEFLVTQGLGTDHVRLVEVYTVATHLPLQLHVFATWSSSGALRGPEQGFYTRRSNLQGIVLKSIIAHVPPISIVHTNNDTMTLGGFCGKLWKILEKKMNFSTVYYIASAKTNAWDNMITAVSRNEVDVASTYTPMTPGRAKVVDFTIPFVTMTFKVYLREPTLRDVVWTDILSPFTAGLWIAFVLSSLVMASLLALLDHLARWLGIDEERFTLYDSLFLVFGATFCIQGQTQSPRTVSARIIYFVMYMTGIITLSSYSGVITSSLTIFRPQMPFSTLEELSTNEAYSLGVLNNTIPHKHLQYVHINKKKQLLNTNIIVTLLAVGTSVEYVNLSWLHLGIWACVPKFDFYAFKGAATFGTLKKLFDRHMANNQSNLLPTYGEGLRRSCDYKFAFIALAETASYLSYDLNCSVITLATYFSKFYASLAFPKMSPYRGLFNHNLLKLLEGGILKELHISLLRTKLPSKSIAVPSVTLEAAAPSLSLVAGGLILAALFLAGEALFVVALRSKWQHSDQIKTRNTFIRR